MNPSQHNLLLRDLCSYDCRVVGAENHLMFRRLSEEFPFRIHRYRSGDTHNGWVVPQRWSVEEATIRSGGKLLFDGTGHPLAVASYSKSFSGAVSREELDRHVVTDSKQPGAHIFHCMWQYRPWSPDWAFSIPYDTYRRFPAGMLEVSLRTRYEAGEMLVADYEHRGRSNRTIVLNAHTCHPHMANDGFAGVSLLVRLVKWIEAIGSYYSYRLVFGPEHLGTVFYLRDLPQEDLDRMVSGIFVEMPGVDAPLLIPSTFLGGQPIDLAFHNGARHLGEEVNFVEWRCGAGNDETVWEAPGYEVPFVEITRFYRDGAPYPGYHTDLDSPDSLVESRTEEFFAVLQRAIFALEHNATLHRKFDGLICLSNPDYDLYFERPDPAVAKDITAESERWGHLLDSLFRYMDGSISILEIAEKHDLPFEPLYRYLKRFEEKGLIDMQFAPIERCAVRQVR